MFECNEFESEFECGGFVEQAGTGVGTITVRLVAALL